MAQSVKVMVRVRPMNQKQITNKSKIIVQANEKINQIVLHNQAQPDNSKHFAYDCIFPISSIQSYVYQQTAFGMVESVVQGYNATIFAYGQTGCGKTFTMMGVPDHPDLKGIIPRTFSHIINIIQSTKEKKFLVRCSFLEIYNEQVHDLLSKDIKQKKEVKESPDKGIYVKDLSMNIVKTLEEMDKYLNLGFKNRAVGATEMNKDSSRSHSIFTIHVQTEQQGPVDIKYMAGKLNLVDLAGSQRQSKTKAQGDRLKEATKINLSLSALGNVISALVDGKSKHIPYRDSKLTRLLQDSLGGNTKTLMIANVSPADYNYEQTLSTLRYASRAKFIKNKPVVNEDPKDALLKQYAEEIKRLKMMLQGKIPDSPVNLNLRSNVQGGGESIRTIEVIKTIEVGKQFEDKLRDKEDQLKRQKEEKDSILEKLKSLEQQVVQGGQKQNTVEVKKYKDLKVKVKKQKAEQQKLIQQAQKAQEQLISVTQNYKNIQQQNAQIRQKLLLLQAKYKQSKQQIKDLELQHARQKYDLLQNIRWAQKDTKFYAGICKKIISTDQIEIIRSASQWNQQNGQYYIIPFLLKQKKVTFPKLSDRQVQDLNRQEMSNRELITFQNDLKKRNKSNWDEINTREATIEKYRIQNNNGTVKNNRKQGRQSKQHMNNFRDEGYSKELIMKSNKNVILAPLMNQDPDSATIQKERLDRPYKLQMRDAKTQLKRNKLLEPIK